MGKSEQGVFLMTNKTTDKVNLIHKRVITWKKLKNRQDTNQHFKNKVWKRIHNMEGKQDD